MIVPGNTIKLVDIGTSNAVVPEVQSQSPVAKAVRNIKKKNAGAYIRLQPTTSQTDKTNTQKETGNATSGRGVVYLSHIPDGFYEDEMRQYFSQFGRVTRVKLARSRKTGRSRGYAFIEFQYAEVAKVVAETMNNYLLYNRLLKASYVDKQYPAAFWNQQSCGPQNCPLARNRRIEIKRKNSILNPAKELAQQGKRRRHLAKTLNRLKDAGVDYAVQVKDEVEQSTGAEEKAKKFGGVKNVKPGKQISEESVMVEEAFGNVQPVLLVDESDDEIEFNVPSFVIRKTLKRQSSSPLAEPSPKVKRGKRVKNEPLSPKITSPTHENVDSEENQNPGGSLEASHETRKSGRVSVIPKHISSGFHVTITSLKSKQKKSIGKENQESQSPAKSTKSSEQLSTPKGVSRTPPRLQKSIETSIKKRKKGPNTPAENNINKSPENNEVVSPKLRKQIAKSAEISDILTSCSPTDSIIKKRSPKGDKKPDLTPKQEKDNIHTKDKRKTPKSAENENIKIKRVLAASGPEKIVSPKSNQKKSAQKTSPNQLSPVQKPSSVEKKFKMQKTPLKTPVGRKSLPSSKQLSLGKKLSSSEKKPKGLKTPLKTPVGRKSLPVSNLLSLEQKPSSSEKKPKGLKTPLKTPLGRKSHGRSPESSPKISPLSHSTALKKRNSITPKAIKPARKSLKLNK